jgi:hypothetical protein
MVDINQKGFGAGKALAGAVVIGGIGLLAGFIGSKKTTATCLACGKKFDPKDGYLKIRIMKDDSITNTVDVEREVAECKRIEAIANFSADELEKKFKLWDKLHEKGLLNKDEVEQKKKEYLGNRK